MSAWHWVDEGIVLRYSVEVDINFDVWDDVGIDCGEEGWRLQGAEEGRV